MGHTLIYSYRKSNKRAFYEVSTDIYSKNKGKKNS